MRKRSRAPVGSSRRPGCRDHGPRTGALLAALALCAAVTPQIASAQYHGIPVFYVPSQGQVDHWTAAVAFGGGLNEESGENIGLVFELNRRLGRSVTIGGGFGALWPENTAGDRHTRAQGGVKIAVRLNPPDVDPSWKDYLTVSLLAGVGAAGLGAGSSEVSLPVGLGIAYYFNLIGKGPWQQVWVAPVYAPRVLDLGEASGFQSGGGLSAGLNFGFTRGLGLGLAIEWKQFGDVTIDGTDIDGSDRITLGTYVRLRF